MHGGKTYRILVHALSGARSVSSLENHQRQTKICLAI